MRRWLKNNSLGLDEALRERSAFFGESGPRERGQRHPERPAAITGATRLQSGQSLGISNIHGTSGVLCSGGVIWPIDESRLSHFAFRQVYAAYKPGMTALIISGNH
jgi:hypothetical protein